MSLPRKKELQEPDQSRALNPDYLTTTQETYVPHWGEDSMKLYQPTWVHLDRQVNLNHFYIELAFYDIFSLLNIFLKIMNSLGSQILWLFQGECCRKQTGELQNQKIDHLLLLGRQQCGCH